MRYITTVILAALIAGTGFAQEEEFDPKKAIKEIQSDLESILEQMASLGGQTANDAGQRVVENIDKLLDGMQSGQQGVVSKIDELIKNTKLQQSQSKSKGKGKGQGQSSRRDRNQKEGQKQDQQGQQQGQKPDGGKQDQQNENGEPEGGQDQKGDPKDQETGKKPNERDPELYEKILREGKWGTLPPETRQKLVETAFRDYFPDYEREIREYLKSLNRGRRR